MLESERVTDPSLGAYESASGYLETIALLQDEVVRLENELLAREEASLAGIDTDPRAGDDARPDSSGLRRDLDRLNAELATRDETINLLLDELRQVEEAGAATRAEWEQLAQWVAEVEERVERRDQGAGPDMTPEVESLRLQAQESRAVLDRERRTWSERSKQLEAEIGRLQGLIAQKARADEGPSAGAQALAVLEAENKRLRARCREVEDARQTEVESLQARLDQSRAEVGETRRGMQQVQDERDRERREYELAVTSLRAQASHASLASREAARDEASASKEGAEASHVEVDMRIRAFRQHLKEIHHHDAELRNQKRLGTRLSRLWSRTSS